MQIPKIAIYLFATGLLCLFILLPISLLVPSLLIYALLILGFSIVLLMQILIYRRIRKYARLEQADLIDRISHANREREREYAQIEALFSVFSVIQPAHPLPSMRGWAISPDFAILLISLLDQYQPQLVLEAGSGVSTIIIGHRLKTLDQGQLISLDHEAEFSQKSQSNIHRHGLQSVARVIYSPLTNFEIQGKQWLWYDTTELSHNLHGTIDFLVIDGPPYFIQDLSRYPALPILFDMLSDDAIILMDDADRDAEKKIIELWKNEFKFSSVNKVHAEKGACILYLKK
ncbi:MAG: class I SAM-dependent methyltransferase [Nodosilinea sp.]